MSSRHLQASENMSFHFGPVFDERRAQDLLVRDANEHSPSCCFLYREPIRQKMYAFVCMIKRSSLTSLRPRLRAPTNLRGREERITAITQPVPIIIVPEQNWSKSTIFLGPLKEVNLV
jgi:hypothetical protein